MARIGHESWSVLLFRVEDYVHIERIMTEEVLGCSQMFNSECKTLNILLSTSFIKLVKGQVYVLNYLCNETLKDPRRHCDIYEVGNKRQSALEIDREQENNLQKRNYACFFWIYNTNK